MAVPDPSTVGVLVFFAFVGVVVARRAYKNIIGIKVSVVRTVGYSAFYFALGAFFLITSFFEGVPSYFGGPVTFLLISGIAGSYWLAEKRLKYWKGMDGNIFYKGGMLIYLIYVAGLVARLAIQLFFVGPAFFTFGFSILLSQTAVTGSTLADILLAFGIGLLIGRNVRVYDDYKAIVQGRRTVAEGSGQGLN
jgi:hypothetical protein